MNEWKLKVVLSTKISSWKNIATFLFWLQRFHGVSLLRYSKEVKWKRYFIAVLLKNSNFFIYGQFYTKNYKTITYKYMSRNVGMELPIWKGNENFQWVFSCSTLNWMLLILEQYGCPNTSTPKNDFSLTPFLSNSI